MIKVCHIVNIITGKSDGVFKHLKMLFELSDKNRFEHFLIFHGNKKIEDELKEIGAKVFVVDSLNRKIPLTAFFPIYRIIARENPQIIQTHLIKPYAVAGLLNIFLRKKFIFNYHGIFIAGNEYYNFIEKFIYQVIHCVISLIRTVDLVLVPSERSKQLLRSQTKLFPDPVVYYNGYSCRENNNNLDENIIRTITQVKKDSKIIAVVGRLEREKRVDRALMLISKLKSEGNNIQLLIFGEGSLKKKLLHLATSLGANDSVKFFDYIQNIEGYFRYFDLILFTSEWEGIPFTLWEAMANGIPIIAPDVGGFKEVVEENMCGLIYQPGNMNDAKLKLLAILEDSALREKLGKNGSDAIKTKFGADNFIKKFESIYSDLLKE